MDRQIEVVVIDDHPDETETLLRSIDDRCHFDVIDVRDVINGQMDVDLTRADIILVDHELEPLTDKPPPTASNGLALIAVLRQFLQDADPMPLLALYTYDERLVPRDPEDPKAHMLARANAFDWAYSKRTKNVAALASTIASLARGAMTLRDAFGNSPDARYDVLDTDIERLYLALELPTGTDWTLAAQREVAAAQPPVFTVDDGADPDVIRQWLLHRIMPYPTFLVGAAHAAARLGLSVRDFEQILDSPAGGAFAPAKYTGPLAEFVSTKYWRAGIEQGARELAGGFDTSALQTALNTAAGRDLHFADHPRPVVGLDANLKPSAAPVEPSKTVRIHVDGWPSYAEPPRMMRTEVTSAELRNMVVEDDKEFVEGI